MQFDKKEKRKEIKYKNKKETKRGSPFLNWTDLPRSLGISPEMLKKGGRAPRQGVGAASAEAPSDRGCPPDSVSILFLYSPSPIYEWLVSKGSLVNQ